MTGSLEMVSGLQVREPLVPPVMREVPARQVGSAARPLVRALLVVWEARGLCPRYQG